MINEATTFHVVLYEGTDAAPIPASRKTALMQALMENGYSVSSVVTDSLPATPHTLAVLGNFNAAADARFAGLAQQPLADFSDEQVIAKMETLRAERPMNQPGQWKPWFPVIDYSRCTNCMQCLSFCLFGVYGVDDAQKIQVQNNDNCKTNCPACSRVCPEAAIMFPKYKAGPINGDVVSDADLNREKMKVDISALLGGDVYALLRERSDKAKSRFSKERDADKALKERQKCLVKLAQSGDIPPEVLMSLPSPDEILRRAEEAKAKAAAALEKLAGNAPATN